MFNLQGFDQWELRVYDELKSYTFIKTMEESKLKSLKKPTPVSGSYFNFSALWVNQHITILRLTSGT